MPSYPPKKRRVRGAGGVGGGCWTNKLYTIFLARLIFDLFLNFYEFVLCSWLWANKMLTCWGSWAAARGVEQGAEYVLCHPRDSLRGGGGSTSHWTINTSPVSNWFPSDLFANANLLFMFLFLFTLYSHHEFNGCPWAAVAPSLLSLASFSQRAEVWTCFFFYSSTPYYSPLRTHTVG